MNPMIKLDIIYQDEDFVAINKPSGLLVHRSLVDVNESMFALQMVRDQIGQHVYPIHRLDKPTSGVLLFALSSETAQKTAELFSTEKLIKKYLAVVRGYTQEKGIIDYPLKVIKDKMLKQKNTEAKDAITEYECLATVELPYKVDKYPSSRYSLLALTPKTGRRHQLRRHMKHISHPIIGDTIYGQTKHNYFFKEQFACHRLLLASIELKFPHPVNHQNILISANLDSAFNAVLRKLNWHDFVREPG